MKKIIGIIVSTIFCTTAIAANYNFIIPNPPGSTSDVVARAIAHEYTKNTGNTLIFDYAPGGDHIVAASKFVNTTRPSVLLGTTTMHVFNHITKDSITYQDSDFNHVGWIGWTPQIWYVATSSRYTSFDQIVESMEQGQRINVGVDGVSTQANVMSIKKSRGNSNSMEMVIYRGSPQVVADVLGGHVDVGMSSLSGMLVEQAAAGDIRILATTTSTPIIVNAKKIPVASSILGVKQFNGGFLLSVSSKFDTEENQKLKQDLFEAINSQYVKDTLAKINITVDGRDGAFTTQVLIDYRKSVSALK
jgi:tripartite-type tricarboxylate transporter receptor subunit TctC